MTTVLIVGDQALRRLGYRALLETRTDMTVVGDTAACSEVGGICAQSHPDVVLMDVPVSLAGSIETIRQVTAPGAHQDVPRSPRVLVLSPADVDEHALAALRAGATGLLPETVRLDELTVALQVVATGQAVLSPSLARRLVDAFPCGAGEDGRLVALTGRERAVLVELAAGRTNAEIAGRLSVGVTTVKSHVSRILAKTGARDRVQAVVVAYETGLVRPA
ncbi:LuxR C-terminal-related transcriptional regulator [Streptomyces sp. 4F14]|uniref:LuxR C-terminal-related transcriptional regulator n=1 Tax=Streptomyces sp. 4F14 TaxID=3394380 RepID=UPI003A88C1E0